MFQSQNLQLGTLPALSQVAPSDSMG